MQETGTEESHLDVCPRPTIEPPRNDVSSPTDGVPAKPSTETLRKEDHAENNAPREQNIGKLTQVMPTDDNARSKLNTLDILDDD